MKLLTALLILILAVPAVAQSNCGNGLPCGSLPWDLPQFAPLRSPTPLSSGLANPAPTATPNENPSVPSTATPIFDPAQLQGQFSTIQAIIEATPEVTLEAFMPDGTPISEETIIDNMNTNAVSVFSYIKGFSSQTFGVFAPILDFLMFVILFLMGNVVTQMLLVLAVDIIGLLKRIITFILDFIPL